MALYRFVTFWLVDAPIEPVWDAILHSERWPEPWPGVTEVVELEPGGEGGLGNLRRYTSRSRLPYALTFDTRSTVIEEPSAIMRWGGEGLARLLGTRVRYGRGTPDRGPLAASAGGSSGTTGS